MREGVGIVGLLAPLAACGDASTARPPDPPPCAGVVDGEGRCVPAGIQDDGCPAGTIGSAAGCEPAGVSAAWCAEGFAFEAESRTCVPMLPALPCPPGEMALVGDTSCHPVMECPTERWGGIEADASTQYVDASHTGPSDGSEAMPWTSILDAVAAAAPGAVVAIEAGTYVESADIAKPVRLWGVCPQKVELVPSANIGLQVLPGANGTVVRGLRIVGGEGGLVASGVEALVRDVHVEGATNRCLGAQGTLGHAALTVQNVLLEGCAQGVVALGSTVVLDGVMVRDTVLTALANSGWGVELSMRGDVPSTGTLRRVVVHRAHDFGVYALGSSAQVESSVVEALAHRNLTEPAGGAVAVKDAQGMRGHLELRSSTLRNNDGIGILVQASDALVQGVSIVDSAGAAPESGRGLAVTDGEDGMRAHVVVHASSLLRNHEAGIIAFGSDIEAMGLLVRDTAREEGDASYAGLGLMATDDVATGQRGTVTMVGSRFEHNLTLGVLIVDSDATLVGVATEDTLPNVSGLFGDGIAIAQEVPGIPAPGFVDASISAGNARAGVAVFGATLTVARTHLTCNDIDVAVEALNGLPADFTNGGDIVCGCGQPVACKALSAGLTPPETPD